MNPVFLKLYIQKYTKGVIENSGLKISLSYVDGDDKPIKLRIINPKDISYSKFAIEGIYYKSFKSFYELLGSKFNPFDIFNQLIRYTEFFDVKELYISKNTIKKISDVSKTIKKFRFEDNENSKTYEIDVTVDDVKIKMYRGELHIDVKFIVNNLFIITDKKEIRDIDEFRLMLDRIYERYSIPDFFYDICSPISSVLTSIEPLFDNIDGTTYVDCSFKTDDGTVL